MVTTSYIIFFFVKANTGTKDAPEAPSTKEDESTVQPDNTTTEKEEAQESQDDVESAQDNIETGESDNTQKEKEENLELNNDEAKECMNTEEDAKSVGKSPGRGVVLRNKALMGKLFGGGGVGGPGCGGGAGGQLARHRTPTPTSFRESQVVSKDLFLTLTQVRPFSFHSTVDKRSHSPYKTWSFIE